MLKYKPEHYIVVLRTCLTFFALSVALVLTGLVDWPWIVGTWLVYSFMAMINSAGFHRLFAHHSYETTPFWEAFMLICGTLSCYGSSFQWAVVHSQHHKYSDTDKDPHHFKHWTEIFKTNYVIDRVSFTSKRVIKRLMRKPGHQFIHNYYWAFPATLAAILLLISWKALLFLYLAPLGLVIFSAALFNYVAHDDEGPNNNAVWTLQSSGEARHKLHHEQPWRWDLREKWYDIDPAAWFIKAIKV